MRNTTGNNIPFVAAIALFFAIIAPLSHAQPQEGELDALFLELKDPNNPDWREIEAEIVTAWSSSGSDSMDLLLERAEKAMQKGELEKALEHLTALTDHAPEFAEGWNARATVFFMMDRYGPSLADIEVVLSLNPRHFGALSGLGLIFEELGNLEGALKAFEMASELHPSQPDFRESVTRVRNKLKGPSL